MRTYLTIMSLICFFLVSCTGNSSSIRNEKTNTLNTYVQLSDYENQSIIVSGFLSKTHGASGLYFNLKDLDDENEKCIALSPFVEGEHAVRIELTGKLVISKCRDEYVCLNVCRDYRLLNTKVEQ